MHASSYNKLFTEFFTTHVGSPKELLYKFKQLHKDFVFNAEVMDAFSDLMKTTVPRQSSKRCDEILNNDVVAKLKKVADRALARYEDAVQALVERRKANDKRTQQRLDEKAKQDAKNKQAVDDAVNISGGNIETLHVDDTDVPLPPLVTTDDLDYTPPDITTPISEYTQREANEQPFENVADKRRLNYHKDKVEKRERKLYSAKIAGNEKKVVKLTSELASSRDKVKAERTLSKSRKVK